MRRVQIVAATGAGRYGLDFELDDGLTLVRADNSMGKSTVANSILYALGGEGMLGPRWPLPLKYCLYDHVLDDDGKAHPVLESSVTVELVNESGQELSVRRHVKSDDFKRDLVQLWDGRVLTEPARARSRADAFLRTPGSAQRSAGFHTQLAEFVGWELPLVTRYDGSTIPLYLQLLFPFMFVEQQHGWTGVRSNVPRFLQVRDADRRAVEFLLALDADERVRHREALRAEEAGLRHKWSEHVAEFRGSLRADPVRMRNLPEQAVITWPPSPPPTLEVLADSEWRTLDVASLELRTRLKELKEHEIPTVKAVAAETERQLTKLEQDHRQLSAAHTGVVRDLDADTTDLRRVDDRLKSLKVDRERHLDAQHIVSLGGTPASDLEGGHCPTCDQSWPNDLLGGRRDDEPVMTFSEHLELIEQERRSLSVLRKGAVATRDDRAAQERSMREALAELRADIRAHRETLLADAQRPSAAAIREQLLIEDRIRRLESLRLELTAVVEDLADLSNKFFQVRAALEELTDGDLSDRDRELLRTFSDSFLEQLAEYGFRSLDGVTLSEVTYLPERKGFDLTHEVSASDTIRLIWAYLLGLMETAATGGTNHPGLLVLDEPGQHDIEDESLRAFLARAAQTGATKQQVLVTVTRPLSRIASPALVNAKVIDFGDRRHVLQPLK